MTIVRYQIHCLKTKQKRKTWKNERVENANGKMKKGKKDEHLKNSKSSKISNVFGFTRKILDDFQRLSLL